MPEVPVHYRAHVDDFAGLLALSLEIRGWTQARFVAELQARTGEATPSQTLVSMWMRGLKPIAVDHLLLVADVFEWDNDARRVATELAAQHKAALRGSRGSASAAAEG